MRKLHNSRQFKPILQNRRMHGNRTSLRQMVAAIRALQLSARLRSPVAEHKIGNGNRPDGIGIDYRQTISERGCTVEPELTENLPSVRR